MTDAQSIIRAVNRAEDVHFILAGMARIQQSRDSLGVDTSNAPAAPLDLGMLGLSEEIAASFHGWARIVHEESCDALPSDGIPALALFLRHRALWIAGTEWADDMVDELDSRARRGIGMLGLLPRRTKIPEVCECGADQWVYHEDVAFVRCADNHVASLADHAYMDNASDLTATQAARILGVTRWTIVRMIERGDLDGTTGARGIPARVKARSIKAWRGGLAS